MFFSNFVNKTHRFWDIRLVRLPWQVHERGTVYHQLSAQPPHRLTPLKKNLNHFCLDCHSVCDNVCRSLTTFSALAVVCTVWLRYRKWLNYITLHNLHYITLHCKYSVTLKPGLGVTEGHRKLYHKIRTHDFILKFHSNHWPISHRFRDKRRYPSKSHENRQFSHPVY